MEKENKTIAVFENAPVRKAVLQNALPAMAAMLMVLIYNLADTFLSARRTMICRWQRYRWQRRFFCCLWLWARSLAWAAHR